MIDGFTLFSNSDLNFVTNPLTGQAAASPRAQIVRASILFATDTNKSQSFDVALPATILFKIFSIQPVPSLHGLH